MLDRIQKILSARGVASRRCAEQMIQEGRVTCNGKVCTLGNKADPAIDNILIDGNPLPAKTECIYLMLNKPRGYVTTLSDEKGRKNAAQLVADCGRRVYPIGRLDMDSEGLLIFTDDGEFANRIMHPSHEIPKTYLVYVKKWSREKLAALDKPVIIDGYKIKKPEVSLISGDEKSGMSKLKIVIHEGRNRQVRKMCMLAGMDVIRLIRIQEGTLRLGDIPCGKWRYLTDEEVMQL